MKEITKIDGSIYKGLTPVDEMIINHVNWKIEKLNAKGGTLDDLFAWLIRDTNIGQKTAGFFDGYPEMIKARRMIEIANNTHTA